MRKLVHTPTDGIEPPESVEFYQDQIDNNQYLKDFVQKYDRRLNKDISLTLKKMHSSSLQNHLEKSSPIRQANLRSQITRKMTVKQNSDIIEMVPIQEGDETPFTEAINEN
jgi:hypothetical protein